MKVTTPGVCGSDLHPHNGYMPTMRAGDVIGHEPMGEILEIGSEIAKS